MIFKHKSVLLDESVSALNINETGVYVDGTLGGGGHSLEICRRLGSKGELIAIDRDKEAIQSAKEVLSNVSCKVNYVQSNYSNIREVLFDLGKTKVDGAILDLGVSSYQLDNYKRGFSYMQNAPLDMRMNQDDSLTAFEVVNTYNENQLFKIISSYGEERWARRISQFIVERRKESEIENTEALVNIIKDAIPASARREGPHPAKRTFQAIRIEVNDELGQLSRAVEAFCDSLNTGGRLAIITFHSLEDRIVKEVFNRRVNPCICPKGMAVCSCGKVADIIKISRKPIIPSEEELNENPRARSAKLRIVEKI